MTAVRGIVVTGVGSVGAHGHGTESLAQALAAGQPLSSPVDRSAGYHRARSARTACLCPPDDLSHWVSAREARRMSPASRLAVAAARMALETGGAAVADDAPTSVVVATTFGPTLFTERLMVTLLDQGPEMVSPFLFTDCVANAPAGQVAIATGARGPNTTYCQREAGPLLALCRGVADLLHGRADRALVGAVDEVTPLVHSLLDRMGGLTRSDDELPRPFDRRRDGMLLGEGSSFLLLEREADARARGAPVLARVLATARAFDASTASAAGWGHAGSGLGAALGAGIGPQLAEAGAVVSGASGQRFGDAQEAAALKSALPELPPLLTPKGVLGEYGGGLLAPAILAVRGAEFGRPVGFEERDHELGVEPAGGHAPSDRPVLVTGLGTGGAAAWVLLSR